MAGNRSCRGDNGDAAAVVRRLHGLVTCGPWDLDVASAMSAHGYDAVKWAEGQSMLAELVSCRVPAASMLKAAVTWYEEAATAAQRALATQPELLAKLGLNGIARR
jgi:hypothetical protein